jgi:hypothetical protein
MPSETTRRESVPALSPLEAKVLAQWYGWMNDLYCIAARIRDLQTRNAALKVKLDNPALANHPKRSDYAWIYDQRDVEIETLRHVARPYVHELAATWQRLSVGTQERIYREETDWPQERHPAKLAAEVFRWMQSEAFLWPTRNEPPF